MNRFAQFCFLFVSAIALPVLHCAAESVASDCPVGSYRLADGTDVDIARSDERTLRWRKFDGTTGKLRAKSNGVWTSTRGWTDVADGITATFAGCDNIVFGGQSGKRLVFDARDVTFVSHGTTFAGRIVMPLGDDKVPLVVLIHGSENNSAIESYSLQRMLPAQGIAAFVYDKRGTGKSGGKYTQDYSTLADDAVAAVSTARSLAGVRIGRIGFQGGSQAGWVVPLAASRTKVDFAIVCFGLAVNALDEDQQAVEMQLGEKGYSRADIEHAKKVARAAENVFVSNFTSGFAELDRLRKRYADAPWYKDLKGDFTFMILPKSESELRAMAPQFDWHVPFHYDPMPVLRSSRTPQLWIIGGEDYEAPSRETRKRLDALVADGRDYTIAYYKNAEHGMTYFDVDANGERISTRYAPGYFDLIRDFAMHGELRGNYGDAELTRPRTLRTH